MSEPITFEVTITVLIDYRTIAEKIFEDCKVEFVEYYANRYIACFTIRYEFCDGLFTVYDALDAAGINYLVNA